MSRREARFLSLLALIATFIFPFNVSAQTGSISGIIRSLSTGRALAGVQVSLEQVGTEGGGPGGLTNAVGLFTISDVPEGRYRLRAELLGYGAVTEVVDIADGRATTLDLNLNPKPIALSEVVVTATAGATQRAKLPFDVARIPVSTLPTIVVSAAQGIQGRVAGAQVVGESGIPGAPVSVLLRGVTSLDASGRNQEPLYILDGVVLGNEMVDLDGLNIESVEVVKGAAAASLYGSRAANGVVQIRTRRGAEMAEDEVRYSLMTSYSKSELWRSPGLLTTTAHPYLMTPDGSAFVDADGTPCDFLSCGTPQLAGQMAGNGPANEWNTYQMNGWPGRTWNQLERFFNQGDIFWNGVSVQGRAGRLNFRLSASDLQEQNPFPYLPSSTLRTYQLSLDQAVSEKLLVQSSALVSKSSAPTGPEAMRWLVYAPAGVDLLGEDPHEPGEILLSMDPANTQLSNPLYFMEVLRQTRETARLLVATSARYSPTRWFDLAGNLSFNRSQEHQERYWPKGFRTIMPDVDHNEGMLEMVAQERESLNAGLTASARFDLTDRIRSSTQVRYLYESEEFSGFATEGVEFAVADVPTLENTNQERARNTSFLQSIRAEGYLLVTNLDLLDRYVLDALIRNDGSSLFGAQERRQWYYRVGGAWRLSQEDFFHVPSVDELKFRYSVGTAGGRPRFEAQYEAYSVAQGRVQPVNLGNKYLKPEFSTEHEAGIDLSILDSRATLSLTYARTTTEDQILQVPQPGFGGFETQWRNAGTLESSTWEATLDLRLLGRPNFSWTATVLYDRTRTTITGLDVPAFRYGPDGQGLAAAFYAREGEAVGTLYGVQFATSCGHLPSGVPCDEFAVNDDGFLVWVGSGGSLANPQWGTTLDTPVLGNTLSWGAPFQGICTDAITGEETTFCRLGHAMPAYNVGLSTTLNWGDWTAYLLFTHSGDFDIYNQPLQWGTLWRTTGIFDQRGVPEGQRKPLGYYDAWYAASKLQPSSIFVEDGTFTKFRELTLSYRLKSQLLDRVPGLRGFESIGLILTGANLFTWTDYEGFDPDVGHGGGLTSSAAVARTDFYAYPKLRTWSLAAEFVF